MKRDRYPAFLATVKSTTARFLLLMTVYFAFSSQGTAGVISGTFTPLADSPANLTGLVVDPVNGYMYAVGVYSEQLYRYNISANTWSAISTGPDWLEEASLTILGDNLYCASLNMSDLLVYNIPGNSWSKISPPNTDNELWTTNIATDGVNIFIILDGSENAKFWRYNVNAGTWTALAPAPRAEEWGGLSYFNGYFYFQEGNDQVGFFRYHVASNSWETLDDVPYGPVQGSAIDDAYFYCMGWYGGTYLNSYDLNEHTWNNDITLPWGVDDAGMCTYQGSLYIIQGESSPGFTKFTPTSALLKNMEQGPLNYLIGSTATNITSTLTASKSPATNLSSAAIIISEGYENGKDVLSFTNSFGITGSWSAVSGTLTLSGTTTIANYQSALRSVKYYNANNTSSGRRTISFMVYDGANYSNTAAREITFSDLPVVQTLSALAVSSTTAKSGGMIIEDGGQSLTRGICWNTTGNPTLANNPTNDGSGLGFYTSTMTGLAANTIYHVRAYARNVTDTVYGQEVLIRATDDSESLYAGADQAICSGDTAQLSGFAGGTSVVESYGWSTGGDGYFLPDTSSTFQPQYVPGANDISDGFATITLRAVFSGPVTYTDDMTLTIQSESTPVAGTLSKTPNSTNACAGSNVSATLTAGTGGNGTDETEYRTYNGSDWTSWTTYTSGTNISTTGKTSIEIRTRRKANCMPNSSYQTVGWSVYTAFTSGAINTTGETICYNGNPSLIGSTTAASGGDNVISYQWQGSTTSSSTGFSDISGATSFSFDPSALTQTTWYRRMAKDGTCNTTFTASTGVWQVTVRPNFTPGAINTTGQTICYNGNPSLIGSTTAASGGDNVISYQWQYQPANTDAPPTWTDIPGATNSTFDPNSGLTASTVYRRMGRDGTCNTTFTASTGTWTVTVRPDFTTGAINTTGETICYSGNPAQIGSTTAASGGDNVIGYQWQSSTTGNSSGFADIGSATGSTYDPPPGLTATTWYRRMAKDGTCNTTFTASTGVWQVTVRDNFTTGAINTTGETICYNTSPATAIGNTTLASGGDGTITYSWRSSADSYAIAISGATGSTYTPAGPLTTTTSYRRYAKDGTCNTTPTVSTGTWTVTVRSNFTTGAINTTGETICYNGNPSLIGNATAASGGDNVISYQWQWMPGDTDAPPDWIDIDDATSSTYDPPPGLTASTKYRRTAKDGTCNTTFTASAGVWIVTVRAEFTTGAIETTGETICYNGNPTQIGSTTVASGGDNVISYQWQKSTTSSSTGFADIGSATGSTYDPPTGLTATTWYRRMAKDGTCNTTFTASTGVWQVTVRDNFTAGAINATGETICYNGDPALIGNATAASGGDNVISYQWQLQVVDADFTDPWSDIPGATDVTYDPPSGLTASTKYRRQAKEGTCNTTFTASTGEWIVTVRPEFTTGAINTTGETICYNGNPVQIGSTTPASGGDNVIGYQWQSSTTSGSAGFADIGSATGSTYDPPPGLTTTTWYRRMAKDGTCNTTFTASTGVWQVTVRPDFTTGAIETTGETICYNGDPALIGSTTDASGGDNVISYQWQKHTIDSDGPVPWSDISGATDATYDPPSGLTASTKYRRQAKDGTCNTTFTISTGEWIVTVRPEFTTGAIATTGENICYGTDPATTIGNTTLGSGGDNAITYSWRSSADSYATEISGATGSTYLPAGPLTETTSYRRYVNDGTCNTTPAVSTGTWTVTVSPLSVGGAVTGGTDVCYGTNSTLLTLSGHTGTVVKWQYSTDNSNWSDIASHTQTTYTAENLTVDTWYRAVVASSPCSAVNSDATQITIITGMTISGYAKYENNPKSPLNGLKITLKKDGSPFGTPVITGNNGFYEFTGLEQGNYGIEVSSAHPSGLWQTWGGVNNTDYLLVSRHIAGTQYLPVNPPVVQITASTKLPHPAINNLDATAIRQAAKYPTTGYTYFDIPKWVFSGMDAATALDDITVVCSDVVRDIRGLCAGDVNGTYVPPTGNKIAVQTHGRASLQLEHRGTLPLTDEIVFPIRVERDMELGAITLYLDYDPSVMTVTNVTMPGNSGAELWFNVQSLKFNVEDPTLNLKPETLNLKPETFNTLAIGWMSLEPVSVAAGQAVILVHARMRAGVETHGRASVQMAHPIRFTLNENPLSELANGEGEIIEGAILEMPEARVNTTETSEEFILSVFPNPSNQIVNVDYLQTLEELVSFVLTNSQGVAVLKTDRSVKSAGTLRESFDVSGLMPGVYMLKATAGTSVSFRKVVVVR